MLTREQALAQFDFANRRVVPDRLSARTHHAYLDHAEKLLDVYRRGAGRTRRELHQGVRAVLASEPDCPLRRIDAFCKLLDDASEYHSESRRRAAALRREVFRAAAPLHPLVERPERPDDRSARDAYREIARRLDRPWFEIRRGLYADVMEMHRLEAFPGYESGRALLSRYNVAQQQAALFDAVSMSVWAEGDFKSILRYAKLARLMHTITCDDHGRYCFRFDGPASVLRRTSRYGAALARFLPSLIACRDWTLEAVIEPRRRCRLRLELSSRDGLTSPRPAPAEFDSTVEERFAAKWGAEPREGWTLIREGEVLHSGQKTFVPDFLFRHKDGRRALLEIVGFWTPEYLAAKLATLRLFRQTPILLAVADCHRPSIAELPESAFVYKSFIKLDDVLERLAQISPR